jgi:hypothetical protein
MSYLSLFAPQEGRSSDELGQQNPASLGDVTARWYEGLLWDSRQGALPWLGRGVDAIKADVGLAAAHALDAGFDTQFTHDLRGVVLGLSKSLGSNPYRDGVAAQVLQGAVNMVPEYAAGGLVGGVGGLAAVGGLQGNKEWMGAQEEYDPATAAKMGAIGGAAAAAGMVLPMSKLGAPLVLNLGIGAAANTAFEFGHRRLTAAMLEDAGYSQQAAQYRVFDQAAMMQSLGLGAVFGAVGHLVHGEPQTKMPTLAEGELATDQHVRSAVVGAYGKHGQTLLDTGMLQVVQGVEDLPERADGAAHPEGTQALYDPQSRTTYLVADNFQGRDLGNVRGVVLHEIGVHYGLEDYLGAEGKAALLEEVSRRAEAGERGFAEAAKRVPENTPAERVPEEILAYLVERHNELGVVQRLLAGVKSFANRTLGTQFKLSPQDLVYMAQASLKRAAGGGISRAAVYGQSSQSENNTSGAWDYDAQRGVYGPQSLEERGALRDAILTLNKEAALQVRGPENMIPANVEAAAGHAGRMDEGLQQVLAGEPVNVRPADPREEWIRRPENPEVKAAMEKILAEEGIDASAYLEGTDETRARALSEGHPENFYETEDEGWYSQKKGDEDNVPRRTKQVIQAEYLEALRQRDEARALALREEWSSLAGGTAALKEPRARAYKAIEAEYEQAAAAGDEAAAQRLFEEYRRKAEQRAVPRNPLDLAPAEWRDGNLVVSTRVPSGEAAEDALLPLRTDLKAVEASPGINGNAPLLDKLADYLKETPYLTEKQKAGTPASVVRHFLELQKANLRWLWNQFPEAYRERAKQWYVGAQGISKSLAGHYSIAQEQASAVLAVLSPQKDWFQNVSLAERILHFWSRAKTENFEYTAALHEHAFRRVVAAIDATPGLTKKERKAKMAEAKEVWGYRGTAFVGKRWSELSPSMRAVLLRALDETTLDRSYRVVLPEGGRGDFALTLKGGKNQVAWGGYNTIEKALSVLEDGSPGNISRQLGEQHKVRSFFNNINDPHNPDNYATVDTHAVAASVLSPLAASDFEVAHNFGKTGSSTGTGVSGSYPVHWQALHELAQELSKEEGRHLTAREVQSVTWEAIRLLFTEGQKTDEFKKHIAGLWSEYSQLGRPIESLRGTIWDVAKGIGKPDWADTPMRYADESVMDGGERSREPYVAVAARAGGGDSGVPSGRSAEGLGRVREANDGGAGGDGGAQGAHVPGSSAVADADRIVVRGAGGLVESPRSSEAILRDSKGRVIPLEKRFMYSERVLATIPDARHWTIDDTGTELSTPEVERFGGAFASVLKAAGAALEKAHAESEVLYSQASQADEIAKALKAGTTGAKALELVSTAAGRKLTVAENRNLQTQILNAAKRVDPTILDPNARLEAAAAMVARNLEIDATERVRRAMLDKELLETRSQDVQAMVATGLPALGDDGLVADMLKMGAIERLLFRNFDGHSKAEPLENRIEAVRNGALRKLSELFHDSGKFLGLLENKEFTRDVVLEIFREANGEAPSTGNAKAVEGAKAWKQVTDSLLTAMRQAGRPVKALVDWGVPIVHAAEKVASAGGLIGNAARDYLTHNADSAPPPMRTQKGISYQLNLRFHQHN